MGYSSSELVYRGAQTHIHMCALTKTHAFETSRFNMTTEKKNREASFFRSTLGRKHPHAPRHSPSVSSTADCWMTHGCRSCTGTGVGGWGAVGGVGLAQLALTPTAKVSPGISHMPGPALLPTGLKVTSRQNSDLTSQGSRGWRMSQ